MSFDFRPINSTMLPALHEAFQLAFADYQVAVSMNRRQFYQRFVDKLQMNFDLSVGAFHKGRIVGFIFNHVGYFREKKTAYNGGTGVLPECRGHRLTEQMYEWLLPRLQSVGVQQAVLEVLTTNLAAGHIYQKIGFRKEKLYRCFKFPDEKKNLIKCERQPAWQIYEQRTTDWPFFRSFHDTQPSYLDLPDLVENNLHNEKIVVAQYGRWEIGYAIYQPDNGRISQLAVDREVRRKGVASSLLEHVYKDSLQKKLTVLNIDDDYKPLLSFFKNRGFENAMNQHEMVWTLP